MKGTKGWQPPAEAIRKSVGVNMNALGSALNGGLTSNFERLKEFVSEEQFQAQVLMLAKLTGWRSAHFRTAKTPRGHRTPVAGDGKGFLDTVLVRERVLFAELKVLPNETSSDQEDWIRALRNAGQEVYVWYPEDWQMIEYVLCLTR